MSLKPPSGTWVVAHKIRRTGPRKSAAASTPHVFIDRSLGAHGVPRLLRQAGIQLTTMAEHYGEQAGQRVADVDWIAETARLGWLAFNKDAAIRRNQAEADAS